MDWMNEIGEVLQQYRGTSAQNPPQNASEDFQKVAQRAPPEVLSNGIAQAFRSDSTPPFAQMISQLFSQSNPAQRAGILNHLISAAGPAVLSSGLLGSLSGALQGQNPRVTPERAQEVQPATVQQIAQQAQANDPSIIDRAGAFYSQHPKLVQGLGAAALAVMMSHMSQRH